MSDIDRRDFMAALAPLGYAAARAVRRPANEQRMTIGCAAITWAGRDEQAIDDIADVGYKGIQLRAPVVEAYAGRAGALASRLRARRLAFAALSSGNLEFDPALERAQLALHTAHAAFVRDAGGQLLQVIDEKPKGRPTERDDYARLGGLMSELGRRTAALGIPLVYHHHMNSLGQSPEAIDRILAASDAAVVSLLLDIAHYQQGGGNPVEAIHRYRGRIRIVHLKDVQPIPTPPGYRWVELGRGRVDVKGCVHALESIGFPGWAIVELDKVVDASDSPKASAIANRDYLVNELHMRLA